MAKIEEELNTVRDFLRWGVSRFNKEDLSYGYGIENAFEEACYLVIETLDLPIDKLEIFLDAKLSENEKEKIVDIIEKRIKTRKPAPYLTNKIYIDKRSFYIDERVNVPRLFLGELLMSDLIGGSEFNLIDNVGEVKSVLDLCCGSAFLSVIAADVFPEAKIDSVDISKDALDVARINIKKFKLENRINFYQGDLFDPIADNKYDLIISNPPYLNAEDLRHMPSEYLHEPKRAIDSGVDGVSVIKNIIEKASKHLNNKGMLLCEVGNARKAIEKEYPCTKFMWFDVENPKNHAFWLRYEDVI